MCTSIKLHFAVYDTKPQMLYPSFNRNTVRSLYNIYKYTFMYVLVYTLCVMVVVTGQLQILIIRFCDVKPFDPAEVKYKITHNLRC